MHNVRRGVALAAFAGATLVMAARSGAAQTRPDSMPSFHLPQNMWVAVSLGRGSLDGSLGGALNVWYTAGPIALGVRSAGVEGLFGEDRSDIAALFGVTHTWGRVRVVAGAGSARVSESYQCDCSVSWEDPKRQALGFQISTLYTGSIAGLGLDLFGATGHWRTSYVGLGATLGLGWLRRPKA